MIHSIFTDGSSNPNPGKGGWATVVVNEKKVLVLYGCDSDTTNNRMELQAAITAFKIAKPEDKFIVYSDSEYVVQGSMLWMFKWRKKGWVNVKNVDLWKIMYNLRLEKKYITLVWVRGHNGNKYNEIADQYADKAMRGQVQGMAKV